MTIFTNRYTFKWFNSSFRLWRWWT